jgi:hypothetical protein
MAADQTKWWIELSGRETIENRRLERSGKKDIMVKGTAYINYKMDVEISIPKVWSSSKKIYGTIIRPEVTGYGADYNPCDFYKIKGRKCSSSFVHNLSGKSIIGFLPSPKTLRLNWPMPFDFKEPAVIVAIEIGGKQEEACFSSDHFFNYVSKYELKLQNGWTDPENKKFSGAMDQAEVLYQFRVTAIS